MLSASSGQVWLQSQERVDTLTVWYSIERGDTVPGAGRVNGVTAVDTSGRGRVVGSVA